MDKDTPITLAAAKYADRDSAVKDFHAVWDARHHGEFDHTAVAVLTKDANGDLRMDRHDSTTKHLLWGGAVLGGALTLLVPPLGIAAAAASAGTTAGVGAIVGHFHHNIPKKEVRELADLLDAGESGLVVVAVNQKGSDITPLLSHAEASKVTGTTWGDLDKELASEIEAAEASKG